MVLVRRFEERAARAYTEALVGGYCHLNLGEEAAVVGLMSALRPTDYLFTNYREHGYAIMRGIDPNRVMAELYGRVDGVSKGWGGSMHMFDITHRLLGGYGIVGGQLPLATGAALAIDYRGGDEVVMCTLGDGTTAIGAFHESLNIAALWNLPIVFVIINNGLGMGTTVARSSAEPDLYKRGAAYRMESARVDGFDPVAVRDAAAKAVDGGPRRPAVPARSRHRAAARPFRRRPGQVPLGRRRSSGSRHEDPIQLLGAKLTADGVLDRRRDQPRSRKRSRASSPRRPTSPRAARTRRCPRCSTTRTRRRCPTTRAVCRASRCSSRAAVPVAAPGNGASA